ncbi:alpha/beta hydrolase [Streptomyces sp. NBC_00353]|uniref:alpha/beta fold hydrolase n=1 Tax=Streptomyces sp. NBC_00353 TaxID=2975722 RepID=UPI002E26B1CC
MPEETLRTLSVYGLRYGYRLLQQPAPRTEPVVILGGALQGMFGWPQMDNHVGAVADVVTADLPGMGGADALPAVPSAGIMRTALTRIIDDLGVEKVNLFGYSYGTSIALQCAQRNPGRIARLILGGVPSHIDDSQRAHWRRAEDRLKAGDLEGAATLAAEGLMCLDPDRTVHRRELALRYVRRSLLHALCRSPHAADSVCRVLGDPPDFSGGLAGVPALVFAGEHDTVSSPAQQREFAATIEGSRFLTITESDHWVVLERPDDVADLVARFFTDRPLDTAPGLAALPRPRRAGHGATAPGFAPKC